MRTVLTLSFSQISKHHIHIKKDGRTNVCASPTQIEKSSLFKRPLCGWRRNGFCLFYLPWSRSIDWYIRSLISATPIKFQIKEGESDKKRACSQLAGPLSLYTALSLIVYGKFTSTCASGIDSEKGKGPGDARPSEVIIAAAPRTNPTA